MRTKTIFACASGLFIACLGVSAHAEDALARKALEQQYAKISQAYKTKTLKPLQDVTTPDFTLTVPGGRSVTRAQAEQQMSMYLSFILSVTSAKEKISKVTVKGNEATVDTLESIQGVTADMQSQGKTHTMELANQNRDTWVKSGGTWLRKHSTLLKGTLTTDGKSMDVGEQIKKMMPPASKMGGEKGKK